MLDLSSLNEQQLKAVTAPLGPVLVLAGAGSGKTRVLTYRIAYLIDKDLIPAGNILALTFTNKAAKEMKQRVDILLSEKYKVESRKGEALPTMGTFHSVGARILRREIQTLGYSRSFIIFDSEDSLKTIKEICKELEVSTRFSPSVFRHAISSAKNLLQTPNTFNLGYDQYFSKIVMQVYAMYQNFLFKQNAVDFDDLLMLPIKIFETSPQVLLKYQSLFQYVLVDEYQDTNPAQYRLLQLLAPTGNLFVVGDDAQSIYGFRGSDIRNILNFEKDFPNAMVVPLEQNYRSTQNILNSASQVIALNQEQKNKKLWTENSAGEKVRVEEVNDETAEAEFVAKNIIRLASVSGSQETRDNAVDDLTYEDEEVRPFSILDQFLKKAKNRVSFSAVLKLPIEHSPLSEFAVLYRTHAQSRVLEEVFIASGIPYQIVGGVKFYERKEIKDLLAYVRLVMNFKDLISLKRVINVPARGIGEKSYQVLKDFIDHRYADKSDNTDDTGLTSLILNLKSIPLSAKSKQSVISFFELLSIAGKFKTDDTLANLLRFIIKKVGIEKYLRDGTEVGETRWENVEELVTVATNFSNLPWREGAEQFLEEVALFTDIDSVEDQKDAVTLMTLHSAKGLEFDTVFFVGLEEGVLPHSRSLINPSELAEEIRLAYVGFTRAKKRLYLSYACSRTVFGNTQIGVPSRILSALTESSLEFRGSNKYRTGLSSGELEYEPVDS